MQGKKECMLFSLIARICICLLFGIKGSSSITVTTCDFDESMCGFVQDQNDVFDWRPQKGSTLSANTGPSADHTGIGGYYMYIETSSPRVQGDNAKLNSPLLTFRGNMCLTFFYHMYGSTIGRLNVVINGTKTVFSASGNKGNRWHEARINSSISGNYTITFEGVRGSSFTGDIAIDDFSLSSGTCLPTISCDFDDSMCGFVQDRNDTFDWTRRKGSTSSSSTGPSADHTGNGGYYMYIETSGQVKGDNAKLNSPLLTFSGDMCLRFFYHMYGATMERLNVIINGTKTVFSASGNKGNRWHEARINSSFSGSHTVTFEGIRGSSYTGDIAIDDFSLSSGACPPLISCDFDESMCGFVQDKNDRFDWTRRNGSTSSSSTGPSADHTGNGGYYVYIETSSPRGLGDHAKLNSPLLGFSGDMCLTFFYHMYGSTIGTLKVIINETNTVLSASGNKGNNWLEARINITLTGKYMITFEGITGSSFTGDIAIDDFSLISGPCPPMGVITIGTCSFSSSMCGFVQDKNDKFDWTRRTGSTPSYNTGPSVDHTGGFFGFLGYYMFIETSSPRLLFDNAKLNSPLLPFNGDMCLKFFYHMYGSTIGTLNVIVTGFKTVFSASGNKGDKWFEARITISLSGMYMITFEGIRGYGSTGDIAIDDFSLTTGPCPPPACSFDTSMCYFVQDTNDVFDWTRRSGSTPSQYTGPSADHTGRGGFYMYIETSSPRVQDDNAKLNSPLLQFSGNMCLRFFYHMYGSTIGTLNVIISGFRTVFSASGNKGNKWNEARITVSLSGMYMITFEGIRGQNTKGDIAIDDFSLTTGSCSPIFDQCKHYKVLNSSDRLVGFTGQNPIRCDQRDLSAGWYRFAGAAAGDRMPTTCPKKRHCGTNAPGWLSGRHPTAAEGVVTRKVCYHWTSGCCHWSNNIRVKNCGTFYVYELQKPPVCSLRYCGEARECVDYRALNQDDRAMSNSDQSNVKCDGGESENIVPPAWYRMTGDSGNQIPDNCVPVKRCGTSAPGWLNGAHPTVEEGVLNQTICYHWSGNCCNWKNNINIRNCGDYYVYQLVPPPACPLRYCGNKKETPTTLSPAITLAPATTLAPAHQCREQCSNGKKCRKPFGKFLCICERGRKGINCQEEDVLKEVVDFRLAIESEDWKPEYLNMNHPTTKELVDRIKKAVSEEIDIGKTIIKSLRKGSVIADVQLTFNESVGESEVDFLLKEATKDGQFGQFNVDEARVQFTPKPDFSLSDPTEPAKMNKALIYGPVTGVILLVLLFFGIYRVFILKRRNRGKNEEDTRRDAREACRGDSCQNRQVEIQMTSGFNNIACDQGPLKITNLTTKSFVEDEGTVDDGSSHYLDLDENAMLEPAAQEWEIPRENVTIEKTIGKGAFGQVAQGTVFSLRGGKETTTVAIKMLKDNAFESERKDLLSELEVMKTLNPHPHVIKLLGCVTKSDPLLVIIEYVPYGDLLGYLRKSRGLNDNYYNDLDVKPQTSLTSQQLMKIAWQIADGMSYLSSNKIIHRDLAARNVLVGEQEVCKVTDFGMARDVEQENIYEKKSKGVVPVKWTAHEGLFYGVYTTKSDVWSYGVVLYEIFTIGGTPYPRTAPRRIANLLLRGYRMPKPNHVDEALYKIMHKCWEENPDDRPTFESLRDELKDMENQHKKLINMQEYEEHLYDYFEDLLV